MRSLFLSGYNIHLGVDDGKLIIKDGRDWEKEPTEIKMKPKFVDYNHIVLYGHSGNVTLSAIKWLMKQKVSINVIDYDGSFLTSMNPPQSKIGNIRMAQYEAYQNNRIEIGKKFIEAKIKRTETIMRWLDQRYPEMESYLKKTDFKKVHQT